MATKQASAKRGAIQSDKTRARPAPRKTARPKPAIKDPVGRYMRDHCGELGKDYTLEY